MLAENAEKLLADLKTACPWALMLKQAWCIVARQAASTSNLMITSHITSLE